MGITLPIIVYTHTDMKDVWPMFFGQFKKYISNTKIYVAVNEKDEQLSEYNQITYDDKSQYTERWKQILDKIEEDVFIFLHEDMIVLDEINFQLLDKYIGYTINGLVDSVKLILVGDSYNVSSIDDTLVTNQYSKFSIQPTITKKSIFKKILENTTPMNGWQFEESITTNKGHFMVKLGGETKRGLYHYDSLIFPYIATAISKGKWNTTEYENELNKLFIEYNINPFERGII